MDNPPIIIAKTDDQILKCRDAIFALRPHLNKDTFLATIQEMIRGGYVLAYIKVDNIAASVIGFRHLQFLVNGKHIYIDDLSSLPEYRGKGYAGKLLDFIVELAKENGYTHVTLDSGYQRFDAHRLYLNKGFSMSSHHFVKLI